MCIRDRLITEADVDLYRNGEFLRKLNPQIELYQRTGQPMTIPCLLYTSRCV